jgi:RNA polymerase sigma factor (sigma-70 family)
MEMGGSVTAWLGRLQAGEEAALWDLHQRYYPAMVAMARRRLPGAVCRAADAEDVAQEAFWGFYRSLRDGRLPRLTNRQELLALLTHITACKAIHLLEKELGGKRDCRRRQDAVLEALAQRREPGPEEEALLHDCYRHFLDGLPPALREFAVLFLAGFNQLEIAERLGCVDRTVRRKLNLIFQKWQQMAAAHLGETSRDGQPASA